MYINYRGIMLEVRGEYVPEEGDGFHDEYIPAHFELTDVLLEGANIGELLSEAQWEEIAKRALESMKEYAE